LVICTTDHGIAFPGMKCNLTDHGTGVLLILRGPGLPAGAVVDAMVTHLDVFPTVCDLTGVARPDWLQGASLLPLLRGEAERAPPAGGRGRPPARGRLLRGQLPRALRAPAGGAHRPLEVHPALRRLRAAHALGLRRRPLQGRLAGPRLGGAGDRPRIALRSGL